MVLVDHYLPQDFNKAPWFNLFTIDRTGPGELPFQPLHTATRLYNGECFDPRDKVYGVLGLVKQNQRVHVDYNMTAEEVFWASVDAIYEENYTPGLDMEALEDIMKLRTSMTLSHIELNTIRDRVKQIYITKGYQWPPATYLYDPRFDGLRPGLRD
jgi:hypothetical protein